MGIECHAGHLKVARKWREGNWHKPTRFPYFGTQAHALPPLALVVARGTVQPVNQHHPLFPVSSCPACPGPSCPAPACRERETQPRKRDRETGRLSRQAGHSSIDRSPKQLTGALACRSPPALQVTTSNLPQGALRLRAHRVDHK